MEWIKKTWKLTYKQKKVKRKIFFFKLRDPPAAEAYINKCSKSLSFVQFDGKTTLLLFITALLLSYLSPNIDDSWHISLDYRWVSLGLDKLWCNLDRMIVTWMLIAHALSLNFWLQQYTYVISAAQTTDWRHEPGGRFRDDDFNSLIRFSKRRRNINPVTLWASPAPSQVFYTNPESAVSSISKILEPVHFRDQLTNVTNDREIDLQICRIHHQHSIKTH